MEKQSFSPPHPLCPQLLLKLKGENCFYAKIPELILKNKQFRLFFRLLHGVCAQFRKVILDLNPRRRFPVLNPVRS